jgi:ferric-dicitrate binding protein FerR (iron transport regulator)
VTSDPFNPDTDAIERAIASALDDANRDGMTLDPATSFERIRGRLRVEPPAIRHRPSRHSWLWGGLTATVAVASVFVASRFAPWRAAVSRVATTYHTANGQRATVTLTDGTLVTLNAASQLDVLDGFGDGRRTVRLRGEALFQVAHAAAAPFVVDAGGTATTVLGTEFGVRAYANDPVRIIVRSGKVRVRNAVLGARDVARVAADGRVNVAHDQRVDGALAFAAGRLVLRGMTLRDALPDLGRWYDADILLGDDALGRLPVHAVLRGGSADDLAEALRVAFDVRVVRQGRTLTLYPQE